MQLLRFWREIIILALLIAFGVLYLTADSRCPSTPSSTPVSVPVSKEEETRTKVTKVTTKPGGETVTETTESETKSKEKSKVATATTGNPYKSKYAIGAYIDSLNYKHVKADAAARLGDLPVSAVLGYDFTHKDISVGIRFDF